MFDRIAGRYDFLNRVMTMGIDKSWRKHTIRQARVTPDSAVLDVCCGTGDLTFMLAETGAKRVVGLDFSANMLEQARERQAKSLRTAAAASTGKTGHRRKRTAVESVDFVQGDALNLPFPNDSFDALTVGFGVRNVEDIGRAFSEFFRVVRPGGRVVCLEITRPDRTLSKAFYRLWFDTLVPKIGRILSGDKEAYSYLPESTKGFPQPPRLAEIMESAGLSSVQFTTFAGGIVALHSASVATDPATD